MDTTEHPQAADADSLLTPTQAAERLSMKPATLAAWRSTKKRALAYVKVGGSVRYRPSDIASFIQACARAS